MPRRFATSARIGSMHPTLFVSVRVRIVELDILHLDSPPVTILLLVRASQQGRQQITHSQRVLQIIYAWLDQRQAPLIYLLCTLCTGLFLALVIVITCTALWLRLNDSSTGLALVLIQTRSRFHLNTARLTRNGCV